MNLPKDDLAIIEDLLSFEHKTIAHKLGFVNFGKEEIPYNLLIKSIGLIDKLSRIDDPKANKIVVVLSSILWTYRNDEWDGLKDYLILVLSRIGFPPSSIMLDKDYATNNNRFSSLDSLINEYLITLYQFKHEIFVRENKYLLTSFQKKVWDAFENHKLLGISAPTSAGKSYIIILKAIDMILKAGGNVVYIVPTLSLVSQVCSDFNAALKNFGLLHYGISTTFNIQEANNNKIYVLTQEKAISAFSQNDRPFTNIRMLVVDEIQNIEQVADEDDQRAKTLYDTLVEFRYSSKPELTVISGPRVEGLKILGIEIFNEMSAVEEKTKDSPVVSFTYAISKKNGSYYFNQYSDLLDSPNRIKIIHDSLIKGYGKSRYEPDFIGYLVEFVERLGLDARNIIFSPTSGQARKTAIELSKSRKPITDMKILSLVEYIEQTVHPKYDLCLTLSKGIAYHHGKMPSHVRAVVERALRDKLINDVACTTTLMQGVNLPAQNVIVRNPDLAIKSVDGVKPRLTEYEIANLRGRAGRLLKDFIGRTFVLEEGAFDTEDNKMELFQETEKTLHAGYGEKYSENQIYIDECLLNNIPPCEENKEFSFLLTYIRQVILKHSIQAPERLRSVGIVLGEDLFNAIRLSVESLSVPSEICYKNRYWDPLDLDDLFKRRDIFNLPTFQSSRIEDLLTEILTLMKTYYPIYYHKYFGIDKIKSACITAKQWMKEQPLKEILRDDYYDTSDKIDERLNLIQNKISFGLPMLLKPLYDIKLPGNMFLTFMEMGAYRPPTRRMIELNIPRETAIYLSQQYFPDIESNEDNLEYTIITKLKEVSYEIDYWRKIQIESLIR